MQARFLGCRFKNLILNILNEFPDFPWWCFVREVKTARKDSVLLAEFK